MSAKGTNGSGQSRWWGLPPCVSAGGTLAARRHTRSDGGVSGVGYRFRAELRTRWRSWLALALLIGAVGGVVVVLAAGSRRTGSAHARFLSTSHAYDLGVATFCAPDLRLNGSGPDLGCQDEIARLPAVADAAVISELPALVETIDGKSVQPDATDPCYSGPGQVSVVADLSGRFGSEINRSRIVQGRRLNGGVADEVVLSKETAHRLRLRPGSELQIRLFGGSECGAAREEGGPPLRVRVVGVQLSPGEVRPPSGKYL